MGSAIYLHMKKLVVILSLLNLCSFINAQKDILLTQNNSVIDTLAEGYNNRVEFVNWIPSVQIIASPPTENTQCLSTLEFNNKGLNGLEHKWKVQVASNTECWGGRPNAYEIWEYPTGENKRRFAILTGRGQTTYSCVTIGPRGGLTIGYGEFYEATDINDLSVNGNVGIGTLDTQGYKLAVNGTIRAKEILVESNWADFVFKQNYKLPTLREVEEHIKEKGTLPNVPSEEEVKANGISVGKTNALLLQKIEELTLYVIQQQKAMELQQKEIEELKSKFSHEK